LKDTVEETYIDFLIDMPEFVQLIENDQDYHNLLEQYVTPSTQKSDESSEDELKESEITDKALDSIADENNVMPVNPAEIAEAKKDWVRIKLTCLQP